MWGIDGSGIRPAAIPGDNVLGEVGYASPIGSLTAFGYLVSLNDPAFQGYRLSSQTWGLRFAGTRALGPKVKWNYKVTYARQADWRRNPNDYAASFYLIDTGLDLDQFKLGGGYEVTGASNGTPFTSFQFPLGSGIRYRGWASKFNPTPRRLARPRCLDRVRDTRTGTVQGRHLPGGLSPLRQRPARAALWQRAGLVGERQARSLYACRAVAGYDADLFATRTRKFWLQLDWAL